MDLAGQRREQLVLEDLALPVLEEDPLVFSALVDSGGEGGDRLAARAEAKLGIALGDTTADERVTLEPIYCLGLCATAPSAMLDGKVVGRLDEARIDALVAEAQR